MDQVGSKTRAEKRLQNNGQVLREGARSHEIVIEHVLRTPDR